MDGNERYNGQQDMSAWQQQNGGGQAPPWQQQNGGQMPAGQPYNMQPYNGQQYNGQPYGGQQYNGQPYNGQPYNGQPYNGQQYNGQPYNGQPYYYQQPPMYGQPPKKDGIGKKIGYFFLALSPAAASLILQLVLSLAYVLIRAVIEVASFMGQHPGASQVEIERVYSSAIMRNLTGGVFAYHLLSLPIFGLWYYFGCKKPKLKQSFKNVTWKAVAIAILGGVVMCLLSTSIVGIEQYLLPDIVENYVDMMESVDIGNDILSTIAAVCIAPIGEELVCRGLVLYYAKKSLPRFFLANILQAAMFGLMHMNWVQGIYAFAIGLLLGYLVERYHSLLPAMLLHFVVNFSSTVWIDKAFFWVPDEAYAYIIMFVVTSALTLLLVLWGGKIPKREERA
ncbi:MAG: CPBP family intramembrane metalloprotease [Lachnospiraceae bacterium]|nr:CPBP family intramembrane metalloprotease [Lachnospiraceae bacterium]